MRNPLTRVLVGLATLAAVVVLFVVLAGGDDDSSDNTGTTQTQPATGATVTTGQGQAKPGAEESRHPAHRGGERQAARWRQATLLQDR